VPSILGQPQSFLIWVDDLHFQVAIPVLERISHLLLEGAGVSDSITLRGERPSGKRSDALDRAEHGTLLPAGDRVRRDWNDDIPTSESEFCGAEWLDLLDLHGRCVPIDDLSAEWESGATHVLRDAACSCA
jgi:hypothetical protein